MTYFCDNLFVCGQKSGYSRIELYRHVDKFQVQRSSWLVTLAATLHHEFAPVETVFNLKVDILITSSPDPLVQGPGDKANILDDSPILLSVQRR